MKKTNPFKKFITSKYRFAQIFSNEVSEFSQQNFRKSVYSIKSNLSGDYIKDQALYIPINLGRKVTNTFTTYVVGKGLSVDFGDEKKNKEFVDIWRHRNFQRRLCDAIDNQSSIGHGLIRIRNKNDQVRMEVIPITNYMATMQGMSIGDDFYDINEHIVFSIVTMGDDTVFHVDRYMKEASGWRGYYGELYKYNDGFLLNEQIGAAKEEEELDDLPLFLFNNDLTNHHTISSDPKKNDTNSIERYFNQSDYVDLADLFQELNDRGSQISLEFIKNLTSKLSVPMSFKENSTAKSLRKDKKSQKDTRFADKTANVDYISHAPGEQPARYIEKDIGHLSISIQDYIPMILRFISSISCIPQSMLLYDAVGASAPVGTTEKEFDAFYSRVSEKQQNIYPSLQRLMKAIMIYAGHDIKDLPTIKFAKVETRDVGKKTEIAESQMSMGIMSKESAMQYAMGYDQDEVTKELEKIKDETTDAYARDGSPLFLDDNDDT